MLKRLPWIHHCLSVAMLGVLLATATSLRAEEPPTAKAVPATAETRPMDAPASTTPATTQAAAPAGSETKAVPAAPETKAVPASPDTSTTSTPPSTAPATQAAVDEKQTALRQRAERYWAARQARDVKTVFEMESEARPGGRLKLEHAMSLQGLTLRNPKIGEIKIEGDQAVLDVKADVLVGTIGWVPQTAIRDRWILLEGQWYHETAKDF